MINNSVTNTCDPCPEDCAGCENHLCTSCLNGKILIQGVCQNSCPEGQWFNEGIGCEACTIGCTACDGSDNCSIKLTFAAVLTQDSEISTEPVVENFEGTTVNLVIYFKNGETIWDTSPLSSTSLDLKESIFTISIGGTILEHTFYFSPQNQLMSQVKLPNTLELSEGSTQLLKITLTDEKTLALRTQPTNPLSTTYLVANPEEETVEIKIPINIP